MRPTNKSQVTFCISSDHLTPDEICKKIGATCDESIWKGKPNPEGNTELHLLNIAIFHSSLNDGANTEEQLEDLLSKLMPARQRIKSLAKSLGGAFWFSHSLTQSDGWSISAKRLKALSAFGLPCFFSQELASDLKRRKGTPNKKR